VQTRRTGSGEPVRGKVRSDYMSLKTEAVAWVR
jgi:hypothetical protein